MRWRSRPIHTREAMQKGRQLCKKLNTLHHKGWDARYERLRVPPFVRAWAVSHAGIWGWHVWAGAFKCGATHR